MYKITAYILICFNLLTPITSNAAALNKYYIPQQESAPVIQQQKSNPGYVGEEVYDRFRDKIKDYDPAKKQKLMQYFRSKARQAEKSGDKSAEVYYQRLIGILKIEK